MDMDKVNEEEDEELPTEKEGVFSPGLNKSNKKWLEIEKMEEEVI